MPKQFKIKAGDKAYNIQYEKYDNISALDKNKKETLEKEVNSILVDAWGIFPDDFIKKHILHENRIIVAKHKDEYIGFCAMS
ncbi:MAG: hypothetical protein AAB405_01440 [Patescibacteria group bacterium]